MTDDHDGRADGFDEPGKSGDPNEPDDLDDFDDEDGPGGAARAWPESGYPPDKYPDPPGGWHRGGGGRARRGLLLALTAVVAAAAGFGVVTVAMGDATASPTEAGATPSSSAPSAGGSGAAPSSGAANGTQLAPPGGAVPSLPPGATLRLEVGGPVTAVNATSITVGAGDRAVTATVTRATAVTGKVTSIGGVKVGDVVSASISGADGKLTAASIQDPASLPSASGQ
jgi:hypothetical protein